MTTIKTETINGKKYEVTVDATGCFRARIDDDREVTHATLAGCVEALRREAKKKRPAVPVTLVAPSQRDYSSQNVDLRVPVIQHVTCVGMHGSRRDHPLYRDEHGKSVSDEGWNTIRLRRLTPDEESELRRLYAAKVDAKNAYDAFVMPRKITNMGQYLAELAEQEEKEEKAG